MAELVNPYASPLTFFGNELRRRREEAGLTGKELADTLGCTPQWVSTMENGIKVSKASAQDLDTYFKTDGLFHRLSKLIREMEVEAALPPGFAEYLDRENQATSVLIYSPLLINGLFQTEEYCRSVVSTAEHGNVDDIVAKRMGRQEIFKRGGPPHVLLTVDEVVLRRVIGGLGTMKDQLQHLLNMSEQPRTTVVVVREDVGYYPGLAGGFTILGFEDGSRAVYIENAGTGLFIEQRTRVAGYAVRYDLIRNYALPEGESRTLLRTLMEER